MLTQINDFLVAVDNLVWGVPLMVVILAHPIQGCLPLQENH